MTFWFVLLIIFTVTIVAGIGLAVWQEDDDNEHHHL